MGTLSLSSELSKEKRIFCWDDLYDYYRKELTIDKADGSEIKQDWICRGQRKSDWLLETSLERACEPFGIELSDAKEIEKKLIYEFQRRYHLYSTDTPKENCSAVEKLDRIKPGLREESAGGATLPSQTPPV